MKKMDLGRDVMLTGLAVQIMTFGFFICATIRFDFKSRSLAVAGSGRPRWRILLWALYVSSILIMVRNPHVLTRSGCEYADNGNRRDLAIVLLSSLKDGQDI